MTTNQKLLILCDVLKAVADVMDRKNKTADEMELFIKTVKPCLPEETQELADEILKKKKINDELNYKDGVYVEQLQRRLLNG